MLRHDLASEEATPLPQRRITPDELQRAIMTLDAKRQEQEREQEEEARYLSTTLSIEQATSTLSLGYTPEEIWTEVRQEREQAVEAEAEPEAEEHGIPEGTAMSHFRHYSLGAEDTRNDYELQREPLTSKSSVYVPLVLAGVTIMGLIIYASSAQSGHIPSPIATPSGQPSVSRPIWQSRSTSYVNTAPNVTTTLDDEFFSNLRQSRGPHARYQITRIPFYPPGGFRPDETLYPERAIPDGYSVYDTALPLNQPSAIVFRESPALRTFVTTRYDGQEYVRCRVPRSDVPALKHNLTNLDPRLFGSPKARPQTVPFTLPADLWLLPRTGTFWNWEHSPHPALTSIIARRAFPELRKKLDSHAWEDFMTHAPPLFNPPQWVRIPGVFSSGTSFPEERNVATPYAEFDASSDVKRLGQVPNGHQFHCGPTILKEILMASQQYPNEVFHPWGTALPQTPISQILVDVRPRLHQPYTFVKMNGYLYLRGWVETKMTEEQLHGHTIIVHSDQSDPKLGYAPTQIQFRMDYCQIDPQITLSYNSEKILPASNVRLDQHAWEKW